LIRRRKGDLHSFSLSVLPWHEAEKGSDRFYAWPYALSHLKRRGLFGFIFLYLNRILAIHSLNPAFTIQ